MGKALAITIAVIGGSLCATLLWGLWRVRIPTFGSRVHKGVHARYDRKTDTWVPVFHDRD